MYCTVYKLYADGKRLPKEVARSASMTGWLVFRQKMHGNGMPYRHAVLLRKEGDREDCFLMLLQHCDLFLVNGGIRLVGQDWNVDHLFKKQSWWIVPKGNDHEQPT